MVMASEFRACAIVQRIKNWRKIVKIIKTIQWNKYIKQKQNGLLSKLHHIGRESASNQDIVYWSNEQVLRLAKNEGKSGSGSTEKVTDKMAVTVLLVKGEWVDYGFDENRGLLLISVWCWTSYFFKKKKEGKINTFSFNLSFNPCIL